MLVKSAAVNCWLPIASSDAVIKVTVTGEEKKVKSIDVEGYINYVTLLSFRLYYIYKNMKRSYNSQSRNCTL